MALQTLLVTDLALNTASIALIRGDVETIVASQCFLCVLYIVCMSVTILETRSALLTFRLFVTKCSVPTPPMTL